MQNNNKNIFLASIKERTLLNEGSDKETYHLVLDLTGSNIDYQVGDCLGIYPQNDPTQIVDLLAALKATGDELVESRSGTSLTLKEFLTVHANLQRLPPLNLSFGLSSSDSGEFTQQILGFSTEVNGQGPFTRMEITRGASKLPEDEGEKPKTQVLSDLQTFCKKIPPLLPRFYSIASSRTAVGSEAHLTVGFVGGTCTHYLCKQAPLNVPILPVFWHPARNFSLPPESFDKPIIMIGPGTGVAPFRGFLQERIGRHSPAQNWLFFGERSSHTDFYYKNFFNELVSLGKLELDCAFSRDQVDKIYVQHKILEKARQLWNWLEVGAYIYVCGDATKMARDVDQALHFVVENEGKMSTSDAKKYIKDLKFSNRYQRDVY